MTWSSRAPRAVQHRFNADALPTHWSLDELVGDVVPSGPADTDRVLPTPSEDLEHQLQDAYSRGYEEGRQAGEIGEATRLRTALSALNDGLLSLQEEVDSWVSNAQENVSALAIAVAKQVLGREAAAEPAMVADLVRRALIEFPIDQTVVIRLNPGDLASITAAAAGSPGDRSLLGSDRSEVQWIADARLAPGGCLIEGRDRIVDGRVDTALERLYRRLTYTGV